MHSPGFRENHIRFQTKMSKVNLKTRFETKTAQSRDLWDGTYPYDLYRGVPPRRGACCMASHYKALNVISRSLLRLI